MPAEVGPKRIQHSAHEGFRRLQNFRRSRLMFIRSFVGQYYDRDKGSIGTEPLNLIFNAIRILIPNLVSNFPKTNVETEYLPYRQYAELLGMACDLNSKQIGIRDVYRRWIVDAIFALGIVKSGLSESGSAINFGYDLDIDPGEIYTTNVDLDNFTFDPNVRGDLTEAAFMGDRNVVSRRLLLESGLYDNSLIERLPALTPLQSPGGSGATGKGVSDLSRGNVTSQAFLEEEVEVMELWVPNANAIVTVPGSNNVVFDDYLRVDDYNGHREGPYTFLSFTPPVPGNPMPVSMVGIWHDLHVMANKMAVKIMQQADDQKSILGYKPSATDDAIELRNASDGDAVAVEDPDGMKVMNFGGQQQSNEAHVQQLQSWFNMMAANPQGVGGLDLAADSATEASILATNANIGLNDMQDLVYIAGATETSKRAFYLHTDPLIHLPMVRREMVMTPNGPQNAEVQVFLTPEARRGEFMDFAFEFQKDSMQRVDQNVRFKRAMEFGIRVLPTAVNAAVMAFQVGMPFNLPVYLQRLAKESGIEWMDEVFHDPFFQQRWQQYVAMGPQAADSKGVPKQNPDAGVAQNGQSASAGGAQPSGQQQFNMDAQAGAADGQRGLYGQTASSNA